MQNENMHTFLDSDKQNLIVSSLQIMCGYGTIYVNIKYPVATISGQGT